MAPDAKGCTAITYNYVAGRFQHSSMDAEEGGILDRESDLAIAVFPILIGLVLPLRRGWQRVTISHSAKPSDCRKVC